MKKLFFILFLTSTAFSQSWVMKVSKSNGEQVTFPVQDIRKITFDGTVGVREQQLMQNVLKKFALLQNYPNPFNPTTTIKYAVPQSGFVSLVVYDVLGKEVATLLKNEQMEIGEHEIQFDASGLTSGVYFYRLTVSQDGILRYTATNKLLLMK
ncbi:MAG: T9SS type A sorting domain-containing protein [Ignavibacteriales bacterium]|nr:T9SS type A sorting domain-containing protein [Ignavibacteriales bacterium]